MNYPVRFIFFGGALLALCWLLRGRLQARHLYTTQAKRWGSYLFVALWIMSIFSNHDIDNWYGVTQASLLPWALLFAVAAVLCHLHQP